MRPPWRSGISEGAAATSRAWAVIRPSTRTRRSGLWLVLAAAGLFGACGGDELDAEESPRSSPVAESLEDATSGDTTVAKDDDAGWVLTAKETGDGPCVEFRSPVGGGENCGVGSAGSMNATIMPAEVRDDWRAKSPVPSPDALFEFAYVYGVVPSEADLVRINTSLGDRFEAEVFRPASSRYAFFVVAIPAEKAPLEMHIEEIEFARHDRVDEAGDVIWSDSLSYVPTNG